MSLKPMNVLRRKQKIGDVELTTYIVEQNLDKSTKYRNLLQILLLIVIIIVLLIFQSIINTPERSYDTNLDRINRYPIRRCDCNTIYQEFNNLKTEIHDLHRQLDEIETRIIPKQIHDALEVYDSDQIGYFDYAAEYAGGSIFDLPETIPYPSEKLIILKRFEFQFTSNPKIILQTIHSPGECFTFYGHKGRIQIKLNQSIIVTHITLEHTKFIETDIKSAPKDFQVFGFDWKWQFFGNFTYNINDKHIQTYPIIEYDKKIDYIELNILNNYGNDEYTCIYRFRVHSRKFL